MGRFEYFKSLFVWNELEKELLAETGDSQLIKKHSSHVAVRLNKSAPIDVRVISIPHPKASKLPKLPKLPVVVFIHGLGGQLNQFEPLIDYFSYFAEVLALDLPGHGQSEGPTEWQVYTPKALVDAIEQVIVDKLPDPASQRVVLVGHSMGTQLSVRLAQRFASENTASPTCIGLVAICPPAEVPQGLRNIKNSLRCLPPFMFDIFRAADRQGGIRSKSVCRMVDPKASVEVRRQQLRTNLQVNTRAWMRTAYAFETVTPDEWRAIKYPVLVIGAKHDDVLPAEEHVDKIYNWLDPKSPASRVKPVIIHDAGHACMIEKPQLICGIVGGFVSKNVEEQLSLAWQLAFFASQSDKWSLKNEEKWRSVQPVGDRVIVHAGGNELDSRIRGMKTLRQDDATHSPRLVEQNYPDLYHVIDISREPPPYDPQTFTRINYHKFPTVSKIPPSRKEVKEFISLVDQCLQATPLDGSLVVHCHYGFNRTGFFICCYLIEKYNVSIADAIEAFRQSRFPGIKHPHFVDELYVRYELGTRRVSVS